VPGGQYSLSIHRVRSRWLVVRHSRPRRTWISLFSLRVPGPFIEDSSQPGKVKTARHLQSPFP
jgi:hypothetical protein